MKGVDQESCSLPWGPYPTEDCSSCMRSQPNFTITASAVRELKQRVRAPVVGEGAPVEAAAAPESRHLRQTEEEQAEEEHSAETCERMCCACQCCTKAVNSVCREFQRQNMCTTGTDCTKVRQHDTLLRWLDGALMYSPAATGVC